MCACVYVFAKSAYLYDKAKNHNSLYTYVAHLLLLCILFVFFYLFCFAPLAANWITQTENQLSANYN